MGASVGKAKYEGGVPRKRESGAGVSTALTLTASVLGSKALGAVGAAGAVGTRD